MPPGAPELGRLERMRVHAPVHSVAGHGENGAGQRIARIRATPAFTAYRQIRISLIAEDNRGIATLQGPFRDERLGPPLPARRGISYLLVYIGAFWKY